MVQTWRPGRARAHGRGRGARGHAGDAAPARPTRCTTASRVAAARRLLVEVSGPAAFDRLSGLAARLLGAGHAKVTLFTDQDTVVGGFGLPAGRRRRPGAADRRALGDHRPPGRPAAHPRRARPTSGWPTCRRSPRARSGPTSASPLVAASGHVVGALAVYDPRPRLVGRRGRAARAAGRLRRRRARARRRPLGGRHVAGPARRRAGGQLDRHLGARPAHRGDLDWDERCAAIFGLEGAAHFDPDGRLFARLRAPRRPRARRRRPMQRRAERSGQYTVEFRTLPRATARALDGVPRPGRSTTRAASRCASSAPSRRHRGPPQAEAAAVGLPPRHGDRRGGRRAGATRPRMEEPARDRAARRPGARRPGQRAGHLRPRRRTAAAAHDQPAHRRGRRCTSTTRSPASRSSWTTRSRRSTPPCTAGGCCSPTARRPSPGSRPCARASTSWASTRSPRCRCASRGGCSARSSRSGRPSTPSPPTTSRCSRRWPRRSR